MNEQTNAQTLGKREIVASLDREFARLHVNSCAVIKNTPVEILYVVPPQSETLSARARVSSTLPDVSSLASVGESVLRSAAAIEQTFGGITANLWDDPFEWTLPEYLSTPAKIHEHLTEVEATRQHAFASFADDASLRKHVAVPSGETRPLIDLLAETLLRAADHQALAVLALKTLSGNRALRFII
jgi:hypothetical protein